MGRNRVLILFAAMFLSASTMCGADNLVRNADFNGPLAPECRLFSGLTEEHLKLDVCTEDSTWNKCARLQITKLGEMKDGAQGVNGCMTIGGDSGSFGFPVKPDTTYSFSLEIKGNTQRIVCGALGWKDGAKYWEFEKLKHTLGWIRVKPDWTRYQGTFKTGADTRRAAVMVQFWGNSKDAQLVEKVGDYVLVDNVFVTEKPDTQAAAVGKSAAKELVAPPIAPPVPLLKAPPAEADWASASEIRGFAGILNQSPVKNDTVAKLLSDGKNIYLRVSCMEQDAHKIKASENKQGSQEIWNDDVVEIFFGPVVKDRLLSQFVVSAGGGRWMGRGGVALGFDKLYQEWTSSVSVKKDQWSADVKIPVALLGVSGELRSGDSLSFNLGRQRVSDRESSSWARVRNSFHDCERFGLVIFGSPADYAKKLAEARKAELKTLPEAAPKDDVVKDIASLEGGSLDVAGCWLASARAESRIKALRFANMRFTVGRTAPTASPAFPLSIERLDLGDVPVKIAAAVNEKVPLPLVIGNRTDKTADYRVAVLNDEKGPDGMVPGGLKGFPPGQVEYRRGVLVKDDDTPSHGLRFDPLPKMDESRTLSVAAGESGLVWLNFDCSGVKPGVYKGVLRVVPLCEPASKEKRVEGRGRVYEGAIRDIPVELEVLPFELSRESEMPLWFMGYAANEDFFKSFTAVGGRIIHVNPWWMKMKFAKDGSIAGRDYKFAEETVDNQMEWIKKNGLKKGPYFALAFSAFKVFEDVHAKASGIKYGTPEFAEAWKNWLGVFQGFMKKHGLSPKDYVIEMWDEPRLTDYDKLLEVCRLTKEKCPDIQIQVTFAAFSFEPGLKGARSLMDYCDAWAIWGPHFSNQESLAFSKELAAKGKKVWNYVCNTSMRESLHRYYRLLPWLGWHLGHDANGLYFFIDEPDGSYGGQNWKCAAEGGVVYGSAQACVPSIRYECLRVGDTDLKYMGALKRVLEKAAKSGKNKALVEEASKFLENCGNEVLIEYPHNEARPDEARAKIADYILRLQKD